MARVHKHILLITDAGVTLGVYGRTLVFRARELELTAVPKTTRLIIMDGFGGSITTAAVNEAASRNIEVLVAARDQGTMTLFAPSPQINASRAALNTREQQFRAVFDKRKTVTIARGIVSKKIKAEGHEWAVERDFLGEYGRRGLPTRSGMWRPSRLKSGGGSGNVQYFERLLTPAMTK